MKTPRLSNSILYLSVVEVFLVIVTLAWSAPQDGRPYTVDDMLRIEEPGEVLFDPTGRELIVEMRAPYQDRGNHLRPTVANASGSSVLSMCVDGEGGPRSILEGDFGTGQWIGSFSPDGQKVVIYWLDGDRVESGVYDFNSRRLTPIQLRPLASKVIPEHLIGYEAEWVSDSELLFYVASPKLSQRFINAGLYSIERRLQLSEQSARGLESSVTALGSGAHAAFIAAEVQPFLVKVDIRTGEQSKIDIGAFDANSISVSPDGRHLTALRDKGALKNSTDRPLDFESGKAFELILYEFESDAPANIVCPACNIFSGSVLWSESGEQMSFVSREIDPATRQFVWSHYVYMPASGKLEQFRPENVNLEVRRTNFASWPQRAWVGDRLAFLSAPTDAGADARRDWYTVNGEVETINVTARLESEPAQLLAVHDGRLLVMSGGDVWSVSADGEQINLTASLAVDVSPWCSVAAWRRNGGVSGDGCHPVTRGVDESALVQGKILMRTVDEAKPKQLVILDLDTGEANFVAPPERNDLLISASVTAEAAVYLRRTDAGDYLLLSRFNELEQEIVHFNAHLEGVVGGTPMKLFYEGEDGDQRFDWLLLPPGHKPGDRHPLVVQFYPRTTDFNPTIWKVDDLRNVSFLNSHLMAGQGYAVLKPAMQMSPYGRAGDPMYEMHGQVVAAAERAVDAGYADPDRWALMGQSYGGYGTLSAITQTDRFRAAVASASASNLTSKYGEMNHSQGIRQSAQLPFSSSWAEAGQGRMGTPPWLDPERYVRNSPLFYADAINTPVMLVHGDLDPLDVTQAEQMFSALLRQNKDAIFLRYWGEGHAVNSPANIRDMWARIFAFYEQHLSVGDLHSQPDEGSSN